MPRVIAAALALAALAPACASPTAEREPAILVGVAASLLPVAEAVAQRFESERGASVTLVTGSSGALAEQLRQGAPLDLILSADERRVADLDADGLLAPGSVRRVATGELVAVTSIADAADVAPLLRSGRVRRVALANPAAAPYGEAARRHLRNAGLWEIAEPLAVYGASVAQALQYVAAGDAELGFVARSLLIASGDGAGSGGVHALPPLPHDASAGLRVTVGVSAASPNAKTAGEFSEFLRDPERAEAWTRYGYAPAEPRDS